MTESRQFCQERPVLLEMTAAAFAEFEKRRLKRAEQELRDLVANAEAPPLVVNHRIVLRSKAD